MAKLAALLAALILVAHVTSAFRTTVTTIESDENPIGRRGSREQCRQQVEQRNLNHCMRYLQEQQRGLGDELNVSHYDQCCNELRMIRDEQCRCEGLQMEMEREQQQGRMRRQELRKMMQSAQMLPNTCGMRPSQCQFDMPYY
ncbi:hypothetical protein L484_011894 [Morus notabilis]|uniref:Bifunctional inhibitor/plant lipid transfer protein/seed storage helical domain-containing protein n=1 Tax=Morus notabilis TaxID=981085 RepID=W9RRL5_9ROSA|nr:2S albumin [Morus notabilis]EXC05105.1 hypothetical protein L484_011894 [Morus notabilis]